MNTYVTQGVCSKEINFEIEDGIIKEVNFVAGCPGNTKGLCALLQGMEVSDAIKRLKGITCGTRETSCPDQFAKALLEYLDK